MEKDEYIQYGGAIFDKKCPKCGRLTNPPKQLSVNRFMTDCVSGKKHMVLARCSKCGRVRLPFVCFEKTEEPNKGVLAVAAIVAG